MTENQRAPQKPGTPKRPPAAGYFNEVEVSAPGSVFLTSHLYVWDERGKEKTRIVNFDRGEWYHLDDVTGIAHSLCLVSQPERVLWVLSRHGVVRQFSAAGVKDEEILPDVSNGYLFRIRQIGSELYACGGQHMVFRREADQWVHHDQGIFVPAFEGHIDRGFQDIAGIAPDDMYCVGTKGAVAHFDGHRWTLLESPTNYNLYNVLCRAKNEVYCCGKGGVLFRGNRDGWEPLGLADREQSLTGMAWYQGQLYVCSSRGLWRLEGDVLEPVELGLGREVTFYQLAASETELWATSGAEHIYRFDGRRWERLISPDNVP